MVIDVDKKPIGVVVGFHNFGAGDLIEVKRESSKSVLLPLTGFVEQINVEERQLVMKILDGLLD